jgi:hypothetical protein
MPSFARSLKTLSILRETTAEPGELAAASRLAGEIDTFLAPASTRVAMTALGQAVAEFVMANNARRDWPEGREVMFSAITAIIEARASAH